jgi:hypothetical protein
MAIINHCYAKENNFTGFYDGISVVGLRPCQVRSLTEGGMHNFVVVIARTSSSLEDNPVPDPETRPGDKEQIEWWQ